MIICTSFKVLFIYLIEFNVASTLHRLYSAFQALLVEEDLRCHFFHYFRHKRAPDVP
jgi:hypothetical protein